MSLRLCICSDVAPNGSLGTKAGAHIGTNRTTTTTASLGEEQQMIGYNIPVLTFQELNARAVDPRLVRPTVEYYLKNPKILARHDFLCLGMASSRHCDIHLVTKICELVSVHVWTYFPGFR